MSDNFIANPGSGGDTFAADDIGGVKYPRSKLGFGSDGAYVDVDAANPLPVNGPLTDSQLRSSPVQVSSQASYAEDTPHVSGSIGNLMLAIRSDSDVTTADDGDYTVLKLDEVGRLKVSTMPASYPDITGDITAVQSTIGTPVAGGTVSGDVARASNVMAFCTGTFSGVNVSFEGSIESTGNANWFSIQAVRSNANTVESSTGALSAAPTYAWEMSVNALRRVRVRCTARTSGTQSWRFVQGTYATEPIPAAQVSATQPVSLAAGTNLAGDVGLQVRANATGAASAFNYANPVTSAGTQVKTTAGRILAVCLTNTAASVRYVKFFNVATAPTMGTTSAAYEYAIPAGSSIQATFPQGLAHATGIFIAVTTAAGLTNNTSTTVANEVIGFVAFA